MYIEYMSSKIIFFIIPKISLQKTLNSKIVQPTHEKIKIIIITALKLNSEFDLGQNLDH